MSMEQAILELAGSMKELAVAIREGFSRPQMVEGFKKASEAINDMLEPGKVGCGSFTRDEAAQNAKANAVKPDAVKPDAELEAAVIKVEKGNVASYGAASDAELDAAVEKAEQAALEYKKDVFPVLLQVSKVRGKEALRELLTKYGAKTGDALKADQFAGIVADANALMAG